MYYFSCPSCGSNGDFFRGGDDYSESTGCAIFMFGGLLPALIYRDSVTGRIRCGACGHKFRQPGLPSSPAARIAMWMWLLIPASFMGGMLASWAGLQQSDFPGKASVIDGVAGLMRANTFAFAVTFVLMVAGLTVLALAIGVVSNIRYHKAIRRQYDTEPTPFGTGVHLDE